LEIPAWPVIHIRTSLAWTLIVISQYLLHEEKVLISVKYHLRNGQYMGWDAC